MNLDIDELAKAITLCFENARDNEHFTLEQRQLFLFRGKILRGHLVNLVSAHWKDDAAADLAAANANLRTINGRLARAKDELDQVAGTVERLANLAQDLERLLTLAAGFV